MHPSRFRPPMHQRFFRLAVYAVKEERKGPVRLMSGFFKKLPQRSLKRVFAFQILALCNGPGTQVFLCPEWASRMDEQDLETARF